MVTDLTYDNKCIGINIILLLRISPIHLFYNLQLIYWHFVERLWLFIYIVLYSY